MAVARNGYPARERRRVRVEERKGRDGRDETGE
jgi:hypothetical protein